MTDGVQNPRDATSERRSPLRMVLLALVLLGIVGLAAELLLLEHTENGWQLAPFGVLALAFVAGTALAVAPGRKTIRTFQLAMLACFAAGVAGVYLHYRGNVEFELESNAALRGLQLFRSALQGATPALAPGALAHLGLIGLAATFRHPALVRRVPAAPGTPESHPSGDPS